IRMIPFNVRTFQDLGLPPIVAKLAERPRGLILVTGPTGSGKSTTLAAMIDKINKERKGHIITVEDPIEFIHRHQGCIVNQREIGPDTNSFAEALKNARRQDPGVVRGGSSTRCGRTRPSCPSAKGVLSRRARPPSRSRKLASLPSRRSTPIRRF